MLYPLNYRRPIYAGERGENLAEAIQFNCKDWFRKWPDGKVQLLVKLHEDPIPYITQVECDEGIVTWRPTSVDTRYVGRGRIELQLKDGDTLVKSATFDIEVMPSLDEPTDIPPNPVETWLDQLTKLGEEVEENVETVRELAEDAQQSKDSALESAINAQAAEDNAAHYAYEAADSAELAKTQKTATEALAAEAQESAEAALQSALEAESQASIAESSVTEVRNNADLAASSATEARQSADAAQQSATTATAASAGASAASQAASAQAINAAASAAAAANAARGVEEHETNAKQYADEAKAAAEEIDVHVRQIGDEYVNEIIETADTATETIEGIATNAETSIDARTTTATNDISALADAAIAEVLDKTKGLDDTIQKRMDDTIALMREYQQAITPYDDDMDILFKMIDTVLMAVNSYASNINDTGLVVSDGVLCMTWGDDE